MSVADGRVWGGRTGAEREARRREQFVDAGLEVFARDGWDGATVASICRAARLSQRYFYEAYASREALFVAVVDRIATEVADVALTAVAADATALERAQGVLAALGDYAGQDPRRVRVALVESHGTEVLRNARTRLLDAFSALAARLMRSLHEDADPDRLAGAARLLSGGLADVLARGEPLDVDHLAAVYAAAARAS